MSGTSVYKIAEQCQYILGAGDTQALTAYVIDAYSTVAKSEWYENRADSCYSVDGAFLYSFGKTTPLTPAIDLSTDQYYIVLPSSFLRLPHEMGVNSVSFLLGQNFQFVPIGAGSLDMWANLKSYIFGGRQPYFVEGNRIYFPKMTNTTNGDILLKLAIALDNVDVDEELDIPRSVVDKIVSMVVAKFQVKTPTETKANV